MTRRADAEVWRYLAPQELFEQLRREAMLRWGKQLADLSYANAYDGPSSEVVAAIRASLDSPRTLALQYTPYGGSTIARRLVAHDLSRSLNADLEWRDVIMTPGAMAALNIAFRSLISDARDEVIVITPSWLDYPLYLANLGIEPVFVPLDRSTLRLDLERVRRAIGPATRAVVLSQPANPTGLVYAQQELQSLAALLQESTQGRAMLISDESHRDYMIEGHQFVPPADYYDNTAIVYSFGKRFLIQGQRIGYLALSPRMPDRAALRTQMEQLCRVMGYATPTALMQLAIGRLLEIPADTAPLAPRRAVMTRALEGGGYTYQPPQATFFIYPRAPGDQDERFVSALASRGVLVLPASVFHDRGAFRIALTAPDDHIERAAQALVAIAGEHE